MDYKNYLFLILFSLIFLLVVESVEAVTITIDTPLTNANITSLHNFSATLSGNTNISNVSWYYSSDGGTTWVILNSSINNSAAATSFSVVHDTSTISDGTSYQINATAYQTEAGATKEVDVVNTGIGIDNTNPVVNLHFPKTHTNHSSLYINFTYNVTDITIKNCSLYLLKSGSWELNSTDNGIENTVNQTFNLTIEEGSYLWKVGCYDNVNNSNNSTAFNITIDLTAPSITLKAPVNNTNSSTSDTRFIYTPTDNFDVKNCSLYLLKSGLWGFNSTDNVIEESVNQSFNLTLEDGTFSWKIGCYDYAGNQLNSSINNITIDATYPVVGTITLPKISNIFSTNPIKIRCEGGDETSGVSTVNIKLTKPSGKTIEKTVFVAEDFTYEFKNKDTNEAGKYYVDCIVQDNFGNSISSGQQSFNVFFSDTGGGEGAVVSKPIADVDVSTTAEPSGTVNGKQGETKTFTLDGATIHTVSFIEVGLTSAIFTIESEPVEVTLDVGEYTNVDLDADGVDDVKVTLNSIDDGLAKVEVINLEKLEEKREEERKASEPDVPTVTEEPGNIGLWITILVILIIMGVSYFIFKGKKKKK